MSAVGGVISWSCTVTERAIRSADLFVDLADVFSWLDWAIVRARAVQAPAVAIDSVVWVLFWQSSYKLSLRAFAFVSVSPRFTCTINRLLRTLGQRHVKTSRNYSSVTQKKTLSNQQQITDEEHQQYTQKKTHKSYIYDFPIFTFSLWRSYDKYRRLIEISHREDGECQCTKYTTAIFHVIRITALKGVNASAVCAALRWLRCHE